MSGFAQARSELIWFPELDGSCFLFVWLLAGWFGLVWFFVGWEGLGVWLVVLDFFLNYYFTGLVG